MNRTRLALIAALSVAAFSAQADDADPSGQFANSVAQTQVSRAQVRAGFVQSRTEANPWSTSYNPLASFRSQRSRADVQAEYLASRNAVAAFTAEDSGSAYLAAAPRATEARHLAGTPANGQ
jgi:hypothetical protein